MLEVRYLITKKIPISTQAQEEGSISTHIVLRMDHSEIWFALLITETIGPSGLTICKKNEPEKKIDLILERLIERDLIKVE